MELVSQAFMSKVDADLEAFCSIHALTPLHDAQAVDIATRSQNVAKSLELFLVNVKKITPFTDALKVHQHFFTGFDRLVNL